VSRELTEDERMLFTMLRSDSNVALVQTAFDGEETAILVFLEDREDSDSVRVYPVAVLITEAMFGRLDPPLEDFEVLTDDPGVADRAIEAAEHKDQALRHLKVAFDAARKLGAGTAEIVDSLWEAGDWPNVAPGRNRP